MLLLLGFLAGGLGHAQNVGIGTNSPHASAVLDIQSPDKGILIPRLALIAAHVATPVTDPADALLVYNIDSSGSFGNAVFPGYYFWNTRTSRWIAITSVPTDNSSGFGTWGDCAMTNITDFNPVVADDGLSGDLFGWSVSICGDYAIVGSRAYNNFQGAAYIFHYDGVSWVQRQKLTASDGAASDYFGSSVCISDSLAIVGAFGDEVDKGAAYIFLLSDTTWNEQQKITASDGVASDYFGVSVCISDTNAIAGSSGDNGFVGAAYVYHFTGTAWNEQSKLVAPDGQSNDQFGGSVGVFDNKAVVGASNNQVESQNGRGSAYAFSFDGGAWVYDTILISSDGAALDAFGYSTSLFGNYLLIGAPGKNTNTGSAYLFAYKNNNWAQTQILNAPDGLALDRFGIRVSIDSTAAIVGADHDDISADPIRVDQGSAYLFQNLHGVLLGLQHVINPAGLAGDTFGFSCAMSGNRFIIGSQNVALSRGMAVFGKIK